METVLQITTIASVLLAAVSIVHAASVNRRQTNVQVFLDYTKRYEKIMSELPDDGLAFRLRQDGDPPPESARLRRTILRYLNMCSEEYYLCKRGYLAPNIWKIWEAEFQRTLKSPLLKREWEVLRTEFAAFSEFAHYVDAAMKQPLAEEAKGPG